MTDCFRCFPCDGRSIQAVKRLAKSRGRHEPFRPVPYTGAAAEKNLYRSCLKTGVFFPKYSGTSSRYNCRGHFFRRRKSTRAFAYRRFSREVQGKVKKTPRSRSSAEKCVSGGLSAFAHFVQRKDDIQFVIHGCGGRRKIASLACAPYGVYAGGVVLGVVKKPNVNVMLH